MNYYMNSFAIYTLGCKVNSCDSENLCKKLCEIGLKQVGFEKISDLYIINTCTVTHTSDKKSMQIIRRAKRLNDKAIIAVCGCMKNVQADFIFDAREPDDFINMIKNKFNLIKKEYYNKSRTRTFIKIQDGCDRFCAYCIVPYVRGMIKSKDLNAIKNEINENTKEIVLTGIQIASYGRDLKNINFNTLLEQLAKEYPIRIRISSIDPQAINDDFLRIIDTYRHICSHFHISLQSGCDKTLIKMNRRYTTRQYEKIVNDLRLIRPDMALTTDIMAGFPGETDEDFNDSLSFIKSINFSDIHVFSFSKRKGTKAYDLPNQVPENIKTQRKKQLLELKNICHKNFYNAQIGKTMPVLFENEYGLTENYVKVRIADTNNLQNKIKYINLLSLKDNYLEGEIIKEI